MAMPWQKDGKGWHLGEKGFPAGRKLRWDRAILPKLFALLEEIEPKLKYGFDTREAVTVRVPAPARSVM